jgi:hypothetical protein
MGLFSKITHGIGKTFKKASSGASTFFKKTLPHGLEVGSKGLATGARYAAKGADIGSKVLSGLAKSPLGTIFAPELAFGASALGGLGKVANIASKGSNLLQHASHDVRTGNIQNGLTNALERAKNIQTAVKAPSFV